jgi:hypothetical protein
VQAVTRRGGHALDRFSRGLHDHRLPGPRPGNHRGGVARHGLAAASDF